MPDLVTHTFSAYLLGYHRVLRDVRWLFYFAVLLPDLITRPIYILRPQWLDFTVAMHTPIFMVFVCLLLAELFDETLRKPARRALLAGCGLHFLLDLLQRHLASGYFWLFPFSWKSFEVGLFWPEATLPLVPVWILAMVCFEVIRHLRRQRLPAERQAADPDGRKFS